MLQKQRTNFNAMKTFLTILIITFFITPVYAGELDGKGLECTLVENPLNFGPKYYLFENGKVVQSYVDNSTPLRIHRLSYGKYKTTVDAILWSNSYTWDRKTLKLSVSMGMETQFYYCQVMTHKEIESILQKQIEALKGE